jgi:uroporphyrinogen decarboxylase
MQTVKGVRAALPGTVALIGFAGAPWTVATYMMEGQGGTDHQTSRALARTEPEFFARLMDILVEATSAYLIAQADAGAEALQLFESWAGTVPEGLRREAVLEPTARIVQAVKARHPQIPIIGFPRGGGAWLDVYAQATGVNGIGVDQMTDLAAAAKMVPANIALQGNLDPDLLLAGGDAMRAEAQRLVQAMTGRPFIFNLGHGVLQPTPPEHVAELVAAIRA